jgi:hypothetical protein
LIKTTAVAAVKSVIPAGAAAMEPVPISRMTIITAAIAIKNVILPVIAIVGRAILPVLKAVLLFT